MMMRRNVSRAWLTGCLGKKARVPTLKPSTNICLLSLPLVRAVAIQCAHTLSATNKSLIGKYERISSSSSCVLKTALRAAVFVVPRVAMPWVLEILPWVLRVMVPAWVVVEGEGLCECLRDG